MLFESAAYSSRVMGETHRHGHSPTQFGRAFAVGIALNGAFVVAEAIAGLVGGSMALLADAGHNLSDVLGLVLAWVGALMARRPASTRFTYGLKKAPILAALFNAILLLVAVGAILMEGIRRLFHPEAASGTAMMAVAAIGVGINAATAWLFASGRKGDINIRGAFLHMAADAAVSFGVVVAGALIVLTGRAWIDPAVSIAIALIIVWGTFGLLKQSAWMSLAAVPAGISLPDVEESIAAIEGVDGIHDLHVWPLSTTENALTAHLVVRKRQRQQQLLEQVREILQERFHLEHVTIQIETKAEDDCVSCSRGET